MEHILLDPKTNHKYVRMTLYIQDVKILYNACVDILNEHPEMIGYERTAEKLKLVLDDIESEDDIYLDDDIHTLASASEKYEEFEDDLPF